MSACYLCGQQIAPHQPRAVVVGALNAENQAKMKAGLPHTAPGAIAHPAGACRDPMTLRCVCCGFEQTYTSLEDAYRDGWDEPDHMPSWPISCPLCPGVGAMGLIDHSKAHERWEREGRPAHFEEPI